MMNHTWEDEEDDSPLQGYCNFSVVVCPRCGKRSTARDDNNIYSLSGGFRGVSNLCDDCKKKASDV